MTSHTCRRTRRWALAASALIALPYGPIATARAQRCEQDDACPDKFSCEVTGVIDCPDTKPCPEGEDCAAPEDCQPSEYRECVSPNCTDDGDCPSDMVCYEQTTTRCSGSTPGCAPDEDCPESVDAGTAHCEETTERSCVPRYVPPCERDQDCGEGFSCDEEIVAMCSGGGSTGTGGAASSLDGGSEDPQGSNTHCTTMPTGRFRCVLLELECSDQSECPDGFSCEQDPNQASCAVSDPASGSGEDDGCPDAGPATKLCLPPYYDLRGGDKGGQASSEGDHDASTDAPSKPPSTGHKDSSGCSVAFVGPQRGPVALAACLALLGWLLRRREGHRLAARARRGAVTGARAQR